MRSIRDVNAELKWIHPDVTVRDFELRAGDERLASLSWDRNDSSIATATTDSGTWTLRRLGFLNPHVVAIEASSGSQVLRFDATVNGGGIAQANDGHHFRWYANNWRAEWGWMDTGENELIKFHRSFDVDEKQEGNIEILERGREVAHLDLLALVGWYLIIMSALPPE